eukprot:m.60428 g.60428  ORF g.60428 m.60428 type:complete len:223 (+) comp11318_c0_seq3:308-976(+)
MWVLEKIINLRSLVKIMLLIATDILATNGFQWAPCRASLQRNVAGFYESIDNTSNIETDCQLVLVTPTPEKPKSGEKYQVEIDVDQCKHMITSGKLVSLMSWSNKTAMVEYDYCEVGLCPDRIGRRGFVLDDVMPRFSDKETILVQRLEVIDQDNRTVVCAELVFDVSKPQSKKFDPINNEEQMVLCILGGIVVIGSIFGVTWCSMQYRRYLKKQGYQTIAA